MLKHSSIIIPSISVLKIYHQCPRVKSFQQWNKHNSFKIFSYIVYCILKENNGFKGCALIPSRILKELFGSKYSEALRELILTGFVKPVQLPHFKHKTYDIEKHIARSFSLGAKGLECLEKNEIDFVPETIYYKRLKSKTGIFRMRISSKNPKAIKLLNSYKGLSVSHDWIEMFSSDERYPANHHKYPNQPLSQSGLFYHSKRLIESILLKYISIKTDSRSGRVFHPVILMSSRLCKYIRMNGEKIVQIDAKSFHAFLIATYLDDNADRERLLDLIRTGFYERFADSSHTRDSVKVSFQRFLAGKGNDLKASEIRNWFRGNFPNVLHKMTKLGKTNQMHLQQLESKIFVDNVFMKSPFWCLPLHDGLCVLQQDVERAIEFINSATKQVLGFQIPLGTTK